MSFLVIFMPSLTHPFPIFFYVQIFHEKKNANYFHSLSVLTPNHHTIGTMVPLLVPIGIGTTHVPARKKKEH